MTSAAVMAWALQSGPSVPGAGPTVVLASSVQPETDDVLVALEAAQSELAAGRPLVALESAGRAIELDPFLGSAYLMRVQILVALLGDLSSVPGEADLRAKQRQWANQAASDLKRYLELSSLDPEAQALFEEQRQALVDAAEQRKAIEAPEPDPDLEPDPDPEPDPDADDERPPGFWAGFGLTSGGGGLASGSVGLLSASQRIQQICTPDCTTARWVPQAPLIASGIATAVVGAGLVTTGAVLMTRAEPTPAMQRRRRIVGAVLLASAGMALATSATLGVMAVRRWDSGDRSDATGLERTQGMANSSLAVGSVIPSLLGGGIVFSLRARPRR